jgi:nucleotide-binding universal stress UspA family protein
MTNFRSRPEMKIVHPTDFSTTSEGAAAAAVAIARRCGGSIVLLHVVEPTPIGERPASDRGDLAIRLVRLADRMGAAGIPIETRVVEGYAEDAIAVEARTLGATLLVLGTHGRAPPVRWLLGSVAEATLRASEVPVLVVPNSNEGFTAWADGTRRLGVLVGLASARPAEPLLEMARTFLRAGGCDLRFVHEAERGLLEGRMRELLLRYFDERLADFGGGRALELVAGSDSAADSLAAFAREHGSDLAVIGVHRHLGLELPRTAAVARGLLRSRITPLLGVPLPAHHPAAGGPPLQLRRILATTDFTERGNRAIPYAYALARLAGGAVTLLHVHAMPADGALLSPEQRSDIELRLFKLALDVADVAPGATEVVVAEAPKPAHAIIETAARLGTDVICMASHGHTAAGRVIMGSVAETVFRHAGKPVLLVP